MAIAADMVDEALVGVWGRVDGIYAWPTGAAGSDSKKLVSCDLPSLWYPLVSQKRHMAPAARKPISRAATASASSLPNRRFFAQRSAALILLCSPSILSSHTCWFDPLSSGSAS